MNVLLSPLNGLLCQINSGHTEKEIHTFYQIVGKVLIAKIIAWQSSFCSLNPKISMGYCFLQPTFFMTKYLVKYTIVDSFSICLQ